MAIGAGTIWRVRPGGASTNGAGYDPTISGAATDYTQQNSAQASGSNGQGNGTTTFVDATANAFTSAMVGNAIRIASGGSLTVGYYFVTGYTSASTVTLDRSPGTGAATAVWKLGGADGGSTAHPFEIARDSRATGDKAVPGNTVYILGSSATPNYASPDYAFANTFLNPQVAGNTTAGPVKFAVDDSQPTWRPVIQNSSGDLIIANAAQGVVFDRLIFMATSAANSRMFDTNFQTFFVGCTFNMNDLNTDGVRSGSGNIHFLNCEFFSKTSAAPTARTTYAIDGGNSIANFISGCHFHDLGPYPVRAARSLVLLDSVFTNNVKPCVLLNGSLTNYNSSLIRGNTFNGKTSGGDDGVQVTTGENLAGLVMVDNIFSNFATAGKTAVNITGTTATNDRIKMMMDYNDFYNNTANVSGYTIGANDLTLDPGYTSSTDLTLNGTNLQAQAYPRATITGG